MGELICPKCRSDNIEFEKCSEYTGGGYADYWDEYLCRDCTYEWQSEKNAGLF